MRAVDLEATNVEANGRVVQIQGGVVDCEFPPGELPEIYDALEIPGESE